MLLPFSSPLPPIKQLVRPLLEVRRTDDSLICFQLDFWECIEETQFAAGEDGLQFFGGGDLGALGNAACMAHNQPEVLLALGYERGHLHLAAHGLEGAIRHLGEP